MRFELRPLPYPETALEPVIGRETVRTHYHEHHRGYVEKLANLIDGEPEAALELDDLVRVAEGSVFDCAAQVWNHDFYWHSMTPGGRRPSRAFARLIEQDFGSFDKLRDTFLSVGGSHFGSGWVWLVLSGAGLEVVDTHDAGCPLAGGGIPLLTVDLWEHAYYLDRKSDRGAYLEDVFDQLLDWSFAERNAERTGLVEVQ